MKQSRYTVTLPHLTGIVQLAYQKQAILGTHSHLAQLFRTVPSYDCRLSPLPR